MAFVSVRNNFRKPGSVSMWGCQAMRRFPFSAVSQCPHEGTAIQGRTVLMSPAGSLSWTVRSLPLDAYPEAAAREVQPVP